MSVWRMPSRRASSAATARYDRPHAPRLSGAQALAEESVTIARQSTSPNWMANEANVAWLLEGVVVVMAAHGERQHAARLRGVVGHLRHESADATDEHAWPPYARAVAACRAALGPDGWQRATTTDVALSPADALALAATLLA